jgi:pimeloyl-ACP methyl ester carboxylesterase
VERVPPSWNGSLVIGAHGGSGGDALDRSGKKYATSETALDDVIGQYAYDHGFAYASLDRDGVGYSREGTDMTVAFIAKAKADVAARAGRAPSHTYIVGLSAGGGITRAIAERSPAPCDGVVVIAGAGGDVITRMDRQQRLAALWPLIDPRAHFGLTNNDDRIRRYAEAIGTPVEARRLWPYTGATAVSAKPITGSVENSTARPSVPMIEVVGTWDDLMIREVRAYRERVEPKDRHRLYQVEGVWHMSGNDDGVQGFQYVAETRMGLGKDVADAMGEGPSYIPEVHDAFDALVAWVERGVAPRPSTTVKPR